MEGRRSSNNRVTARSPNVLSPVLLSPISTAARRGRRWRCRTRSWGVRVRVVDREDDFLATEAFTAERAADGYLAMFIGLDRDVVNDLPVGDGADGEGAGDGGNMVLLGLVDAAFGVLEACTCRGLHAQSNAGGHAGIPGHGARDTGTTRASACRGALGEHGCAAAEQREQSEAGDGDSACCHSQRTSVALAGCVAAAVRDVTGE
jgi:hypothetical protein